HDVEFNDVVCLGKDKGSIVLTPDSSRTIESVWLRKDNVDYKSGVISDLEAGTYTIKVVDDLCPSKEDVRTDTIHAPQKELKITKSTIIIDPTCHEKDGVIELKVSGGWGGYRKITDLDEYNIDNESYLEKVIASDNGILRFDSISSGKRDFTIVDEGLCVLTYSIEIPEYKNPYITKAETDTTSCYGTSDGAIRILSVQTNSSKVCVDSIYIDNGIDITGKTYDTNVENLAAGNYKLWLVDDNGCKTDANKVYSIPIEQPAPLTLTVTKEADVSSYGESDAVIKVSAEGGNNCDKKIYVKKRDVEGNDVQIGEENFEFEKINEKFFIGEAATRSSDHNIVKYNFGKGIYTFQVRDVLNDCPSNIVDNIIVESPSEPLSAQITTHQALCHNETGFVEITPTGGWGAPYTIEFNNIPYQATQGKPTVKVDQLESGRYLVTIRDSKARAVYKDYADVPLPNDSISFGKGTFFSAETCSENGNAHIEIVGGSGSYPKITYNNKNFGTDIFDINNLKAGHYSVIIEDSNECEATLEFEIEDNKLTAKVQSYNTIDGGATLKAVVNGGIEPYRYEWSREDGQLNGVNKGEIIDRLEHGIYAVKVTDASGCDAASESNVLTDGDKAMNVVLLQRETSENASDGFVVLQSDTTIFVSKVLYHVHNGATDSINIDNEFIGDRLRIDGLAGGTYFVKCMLSNGIMRMSPRFEIKPYQRLKIDNIDVRHVTQPHLVDGQAKIILEGGIPPFVVTATNTTNPTCEPTKIISDVLSFDMDALIAGEYALSIVDSTNNVVDSAFIVEEPDELTLLAEVSPTLCHDDPSGEVKLTATGGWGKFMFEYADNGYKKQNEYLRLSSGLQKFKVIDRYGTTKSIDVVIEQPDEVRIQSAKVDSVDCFGRNTGKITFGVTGGNSAYTIWYSEKDGNKILYSKNGTILSDRYKGTYIVTFTDGNGCKSPDTISIYIPEPDLLELANDYVTHTTCELDNGKIAIEVKGGSLPYIYEWKENGATYSGAKTVNMVRSEAENLKQNASYLIDITDSHGCKTQYEKLIEHSENPRVLGVATTDVLCYGSSDGIAEVDSSQVKWGKPAANYYLTWPQGQTGVMSVNTLSAGRHTVRITDDNNCTTTTDFTTGTPQPVKNHLAGLRDALCFGYSDGRIETHTTGGVGEYTYVWNTGETTSYADSLKAGMYKVIVTDSHECKDSATYEVTEPEELKVNLGDDVLICPGNIHVFDAGEYATYSWSSVASGEEIETERYLATGEEGDYAIKVTNEIGCIARDTVNMAIGENALEAEFLMASDAAVNDTIMLIRLSNMPVDSVRWQYDKLVTVDVEDAEDYMFPLMAE
ncbi:MAG: SprB repeat-containing protein, partial [Bacteroidales bacterium]|nr:SprB repeat-containing protein [Bacteroidales bacterium]